MEHTVQIQAPLPHIKSVNIWLLRGDPLTLIDTGPAHRRGARRARGRPATGGAAPRGHRARHPDPPPPRPLGADRDDRGALRAPGWPRSIAPPTTARSYVERSAADRSFSVELMRHHGVPESVIEANEGFWDFIRDTSEAFDDRRRALRRRCRSRAGGRDLRILARPGHSTTDTLLVDEASGTAFVGDHLLAGHLVEHRDRAGGRAHRIAAAGADRVPGQPQADRVDAARPAADRSRGPGHRSHAGSCSAASASTSGGASASSACSSRVRRRPTAIAGHLWSARTVAEQPLLVVWEVLGHLDLLLDEGTVSEESLDDGSRYGKAWFSLPRAERRGHDASASNGGARETPILYPGVDRSAELE